MCIASTLLPRSKRRAITSRVAALTCAALSRQHSMLIEPGTKPWNAATSRRGRTEMPLPADVTVPPGWTAMEELIETVPNPNARTEPLIGAAFFVRLTYKTTWPAKGISVTEGAPDACSQQAFARWEANGRPI